MIKVFLVDDHELVCEGFKALLKAYEEIAVIGVASSGEEAIGLIDQLNPDVVLMDINMPGIGGLEASRRIVHRHPTVRIIALSAYDEAPMPRQLLSNGALGFISKNSTAEEMVTAIKTVYRGERYLCTKVANKVAFSTLPGRESTPFDDLSRRELEVLTLTLQGKSIKEMSEILSLSPKTVNTYRYRVYEKVGTKNDVELTRLAAKFKLIDDISY